MLQREGQVVDWERQEAFRVRRTAILGAECATADLRLLMMDFVPPEWPLILRTVVDAKYRHAAHRRFTRGSVARRSSRRSKCTGVRTAGRSTFRNAACA